MQRDFVYRFGWLLVTAVCLFAWSLIPDGATPTPQWTFNHKLTLAMIAGCLAYALDVVLFPYARPDGYLKHGEWTLMEPGQDGDADYPIVKGYELVFAAAMLRRALIVVAVVLGVCLGM